ncbi:hypothetical protein NDU88_001497 [Pleurodeles waltl]|uniref:Uncharacterized protein n=1 Tax=Pleurodeles waltl TaxID=8319 RepID=A0AAV7V9W6_PLEWA|nr:hypothetical protein NDU88_001497 [Pleurodeles waltl]
MGVRSPIRNGNGAPAWEEEDGETERTKNQENRPSGDGETALCGAESRATTKPQRLEEAETRKSQRIQTIEEGEDAQKPATFCEEHGHFRYGVGTGAGEEG